MSQPPDLRSFLGGFLAEAEEHLRSANAQLVALDELVRRGTPGHRQVRELYRSMHTIKGLAGMVGVEPIVAISHALETVLRTADRAGGRLPHETLDLLQRGVRAVEARVRALEEGREVEEAPRELVEALEDLEVARDAAPADAGSRLHLPGELHEKHSDPEREELASAVATGRRAVRVDFVPSPERAAEGMNITRVREDVGRLGDIVKVIPLSRPASEDAPGGLAFALLLATTADDAAIAAAAGADGVEILLERKEERRELEPIEPHEPQRRRYVRVDVDRLDAALEKLSALVVSRHRLERAVAKLAERGTDVRELAFVAAENARQLRDLRAAIMSARLVPVEELLERIPLMVRGIARGTGKQVRLSIETGRAELDKAVGERIFPAIVHLVRNAVDHGIESPEERRAAGKPEEGHVEISGYERGNNTLELLVTDDGAGIDVVEVARRAGVPTPANEAELLDLLARPGLSTKDETTTTSGRGLGVDIVRRLAVHELGGELSVWTQPGRGTTFRLRLPLSITILDAFSFQCGDQTFVVPVSAVEELIELEEADRVRLPGDGDVELLRRRGRAIPIFDLGRALGLAPDGTGRPKAIVVRRGGDTWAFAVDRMCGQQEVVVRPVADPLVRRPGIAGTTDLGDGRPSLVLDLPSLGGAAAGEQA